MIKIHDGNFVDEFGRKLLLRGVNLGGSSKIPVSPNGATWNKDGFYDHKNVSFVGRPFPLAEADEHFSRLRAWGFTFVRFLVTWEAVEHAGPGSYDFEYLDYLYAVVKKAGEYGIQVFIDPHQDVWSRFTGGDGAPGWTLERVGFDITKLHTTGAAILHQEYGAHFPPMIWPTNYNKLAAGTMFTLFFAGDDFAPDLTIEGVSIQAFLQIHYINAIKQIALRLQGLTNVVGFECFNEPSNGFIGETDLNQPAKAVPVFIGETPTIFQGMLLGSGYTQTVDVYKLGLTGFRKKGQSIVNPQGEQVWLPGREDIWKLHGVWGEDITGKPGINKNDYFSFVNGRKVNFYVDYFKPFINRLAREIRLVKPEAIIFLEGVPSMGELTWDLADVSNIVHAAHWYDGLTLMRKSFTSWLGADSSSRKILLGQSRVRRSFVDQIGRIIQHSKTDMNNAPTLIGEVGIPFDMHKKEAYRSGNFVRQMNALDATMTALEKNYVSFTLWNYTADNTNIRGDLWNDEDLSLYSRDQKIGSGSIHDGGRALLAAVRPYPCKTAGDPLEISFEIRTKIFEYKFRHIEHIETPTDIFVPEFQYPDGFQVEVSDGTYEYDRQCQTLTYRYTLVQPLHTIRIKPA
jgi:hypothetical protein